MNQAEHCDEYWKRVAGTSETRSSESRLLGAQIAAHCGAGSILDLGCGDGVLTRELAHRGFDVVGVDISSRAIVHAQRYLPERVVVADMRCTPFADASFDTVIAVNSAEWLVESDVTQFCAELFRVARKRVCLWIAKGCATTSPRGATARPRIWWEQRLFEKGFVPCAMPWIESPQTAGEDTGRFAVAVERPVLPPVPGSDRKHSFTLEDGMIRERDAIIRALQQENGRLAQLIESKDASFASLAGEVRRLECALESQRNSNWSRLGDALRQPFGTRMILDAGALGVRVMRNRLRSPARAGELAPVVQEHADEEVQVTAPRKHAPYVVRMPEPAPGALPRVVHVIANFMTGGSSRLVVDLLEHLGDRYEQRIVTSYVPDPPAYVGAQVEVLQVSAGEKGFARPFADADLIHVHYWGEGDEPWYRNAFAGAATYACPVVENVNTPVVPFRSPLVSRYVFVSDWVHQKFGEGNAYEEVIYPGSDLGLFQHDNRDADDGNTIGMVYRLERDKLDENAIDPIILAVRARPRTRALIVGGGSLLPEFKRRVAVAGLAERFTFTDYVAYSDLPALYSRMTLFVTPVWKESFGQVSVFAMAAGVPVVGYATGAIPEIIADPDLVVPYGNGAALADVMVRLLDDPVARQAVAARNLKRAYMHYSTGAMVERYASVYEALLGRHA